VHGVDPGGSVVDECLAGGGGVNAADETVGEIEIQDGVVGAETERGIGHGGGDVGLCGGRLAEDGSGGGEEEKQTLEDGDVHYCRRENICRFKILQVSTHPVESKEEKPSCEISIRPLNTVNVQLTILRECGRPDGQFVSTLCFSAKSTEFKNLKGSEIHVYSCIS
jgi:hypothetical protein